KPRARRCSRSCGRSCTHPTTCTSTSGTSAICSCGTTWCSSTRGVPSPGGVRCGAFPSARCSRGSATRATDSSDEGTSMHELVIRGGTVVDGTGAPVRTADVAVDGGLIVEVGRVETRGRREIDADGLLVTPGFVDMHTHFDGQATWDPHLTPSCWHGVTTAVLGNCGVGFAPASPTRHDWLIGLMEGVEDIPGSALSEGMAFDWESFPDYLDALDRMPRALDIGTHVPHGAVR